MSTTEDTILTGETQTTDGSSAPPPAPEAKKPAAVDYKLAVPPGLEVDSDGIVALAKRQGLSQDQAQALVDRELEVRKSFEGSQLAAYDKKLAEWADAARGDSELGGEKFTENVAKARSVLERFGSEQLRSELNASGLGNHPEFIRLLKRVGDAFDEDKFVFGGYRQPEKQKTLAERLYRKDS